MSTGIAELATERWEHAGLECCIVPGSVTGKNGYVRMPESFRSRKLFYDDISYEEVDVHGGLTYGMDDAGWVGFDTAHLGDTWIPDSPDEPETPLQRAHKRIGAEPEPITSYTTFWTTERLREEVNRLAEQLAAWCERHPDFEGEMTPDERHEQARRRLREWSAGSSEEGS